LDKKNVHNFRDYYQKIGEDEKANTVYFNQRKANLKMEFSNFYNSFFGGYGKKKTFFGEMNNFSSKMKINNSAYSNNSTLMLFLDPMSFNNTANFSIANFTETADLETKFSNDYDQLSCDSLCWVISGFQLLWDFLYWRFSGFGVRPLNTFYCCAIIVSLSSLIYANPTDWGNPGIVNDHHPEKKAHFCDIILYSIGCFTFLSHGTWHTRDYFKVVTAFESISGFVLFAIFMAALTKQLGVT
jgi:hypothetical protein